MKDYSIEAQIKNNYAKIRNIVYGRAFAYFIEKDDLLSAVHYKLAKAIQSNSFDAQSDDQFWAYLHMLVNNTARDYRRRMQRRVMTDDIDEVKEVQFNVIQSDYDMREFTNHISLELVKKLSTREKIIFKTFFVDDLKYEDVAAETGIKLGSVKTLIYSIRKKANLIFGDQYKSLVA